MANFYYAKNGGLATGDAGRFSSAQTGSFATLTTANYYDGMYDANTAPTTPAVAGDLVLISNVSVKNYGATKQLNCLDGVWYLSVDDTAIDSLLYGATEECTGGSYILMIMSTTTNIEAYFTGIHFKSKGDTRILKHLDQRVIAEDCNFELTNTTVNRITVNDNSYSGYVKFIRPTFTFGGEDQELDLRNGCVVDIDEGVLAGTPTTQFSRAIGSGVSTINISNSDFSNMAASPDVISSQTGGVNLNVTRSLFPESTNWVAGATDVIRSSNISVRCVGIGAGLDNYHYYYDSPLYLGVSEEDLIIYRTAGATYDNTNGFSTRITTESTVSQIDPQCTLLRTINLSTGYYSTDITFTVHFSRDGSSVALDNSQFWIRIVYVDGDEQAKGVSISTKSAILSTPSAPTTETELWTGLSGTNIQMSVNSGAITIGTGAGNIASGIVEVYAYCAVPSITVNVCPDVVVS